jgi:hypothetical protein
MKYEDLKEIDLQYFIEVQGLQGIRKDLKRLTNKNVCLLKMDQTMPKLMEIVQNFMAIKLLNFLYVLKCMFQTPPCGIQW